MVLVRLCAILLMAASSRQWASPIGESPEISGVKTQPHRQWLYAAIRFDRHRQGSLLMGVTPT